MALTTLTGQNIQDTYQKVVQTDGTNLADGTGSLLPISIDGNDVTISGSLTANEYIVSSSVTNITVATLSGSTNFGDDTGDTHKFTGSLFISGTYVGINNDNPNYPLDVGGIIHSTHTVNCSGLYSSFGTFTGNINANGNIVGDGITNISGINTLTIGGNAILGNATTDAHTINGTLSATNNVTSTTLMESPTGSFKKLKGDTSLATGLFVNGTITASSTISSSGALYGEHVYRNDIELNDWYLTILNSGVYSSSAQLPSGLYSSSLQTLGNITASGNISSSGVITADIFNVKGTKQYRLNGDKALYLDSQDIYCGHSDHETYITSSGVVDISGHITASSNISASGYVIANYFDSKVAATGYKLSGAKVLYVDSSVYKLGRNTSKINITGSNIILDGPVTASGNISSSGDIRATKLVLGNAQPVTPSYDFHIKSSGNVNAVVQSTGNNNAAIQLLNNQTPDWTIINKNTAGGLFFQASHDILHLGDDGEVKSSGSLYVESPTGGHITASGNISASGTISGLAGYTQHDLNDVTTGTSGSGDIVKFGTGTSVAGKIYHYKSDGSWELAVCTAIANCDGMLAVALGTDPDVDGMLLRGMCTLHTIQGTQAVGDVLYLSETAGGTADCVAPSAEDEVVRIIGYNLHATSKQIWFNPDNTWVELS